MTIEIVKEITREHEEQYDGILSLLRRGQRVRVIGVPVGLPHLLGKFGTVEGHDRTFPNCYFVDMDDYHTRSYFKRTELEVVR